MVDMRIALVSSPVLVCFQYMKSRGFRNVQSKHIHKYTPTHPPGVSSAGKGNVNRLKTKISM